MYDHGMFGFLSEGRAESNTTSLEVLKEFAKEAAIGLLGKDKTPLNYTIQKTAQSENLVPDHISIICQEANKAVHGEMFKTAENKYVDFEVADASVIVSNLEKKLTKTAGVNFTSPESFFDIADKNLEKVASEGIGLSDEFDLAPGEKASMGSDFSFTKQAGHDGLKTPQAALNRKNIMTKQAEMEGIASDLIVLQASLESSETRFIKEARNLLLPYNLHERPEKFSVISEFCKSAGLSKDTFSKLTSHLDIVMKKQGLLEKTAGLQVGPEYISDNLDAKIINGDHALSVTIKTIVDKEKRKEIYKNRYNWIQTELAESENGDGAILGQKAKGL